MEKFAVLDVGVMFFIKTGRVPFFKLRGKRGMFFYWAGFLAGYWRGISIVEDLTCQYLEYEIISNSFNGYHKNLGYVKCSD